MEHITVKAKKTIRNGKLKVIYDYDVKFPVKDIVQCFSQHLLSDLTVLAQNLLDDDFREDLWDGKYE